MMSIYSWVCRIYTPRHTFHLRYPCISVDPPSLLKDGLGGRDRARLEEYLEAVNLERVVQEGGATGGETLFNASLVILGM